MRAKDFIFEREKWKTKHGKIDARQAQATPGAYTNDADRYYGLYRASMFMARAPGNDDDMDIDSVAATAYIGAYTDADKQKIDAAHKALGIKTKTQARGPSEEMSDTNTRSPITGAKWQRKK